MFAPLFVEGDDFIDEFDVSETTALGFANDFGSSSEKLYIQHFEISLDAAPTCRSRIYNTQILLQEH